MSYYTNYHTNYTDPIIIIYVVAVFVIIFFIVKYLYSVAPYNQPIAQQFILPKGVVESVLLALSVAFIIAVIYTKRTRQVSY